MAADVGGEVAPASRGVKDVMVSGRRAERASARRRLGARRDAVGRVSFVVRAVAGAAEAEELAAELRLAFPPGHGRVAVLLVVPGGSRDSGHVGEALARLRALTTDVVLCSCAAAAATPAEEAATAGAAAAATPLPMALASAASRAEAVVVAAIGEEVPEEARDAVDGYTEPWSPSARARRVLVVDHNDSFTLNLVHMLQELGVTPTVVNAFSGEADVSSFGSVLLSPGPGNPVVDADVGMSRGIVACAGSQVPVLGVCLGHQLLAHARGGVVQRARFPLHGGVSRVTLETDARRDPLFRDIPEEFDVVRYHSLAVENDTLPECLAPLAYAGEADGSRTLMAFRHRSLPQWGVQYHPESIGSHQGLRLLHNFVDIGRRIAIGRLPAHGLPDPPPVARLASSSSSSADEGGGGGPAAKRPRVLAAMTDAAALAPAQRLEFTWRRLDSSAAELFEVFSGLGRPRILLESARVVPGFSRFSFAAGEPCLGPRSFTVEYSRKRGVMRCSGPGRPFKERAVGSVDEFYAALACLLPSAPVRTTAPFDFAGGLVGYLGYELREDGPLPAEEGVVPDACFLFVDQFLAYDHLLKETYACSLDPAGAAEPWALGAEAARLARGGVVGQQPVAPTRPAEIRFSAEHGHDEYVQCVERCKEHIRSGASYELCLTTQISATAEVCPLEVFRQLRELNPAPYGFMYDFELGCGTPGDRSFAVLGSSPERFLSVDRNGVASCKPMKGTARRDLSDAKLDAEVKRKLGESAKDRAENLMIVDLVRHDLSAVSEPSSVRVPQLMDVETYASVHQMVSLVRGQLLPLEGDGGAGGGSATTARLLGAVRACFPAGSMTGAPKLRSMELLHELEHRRPRGVFSGASGFLSASGAADLAVVIRTAVVRRGPQPSVTVGAGGAVTLLSGAEEELAEMLLKAERVLQAVARYAPTSLRDARGEFAAVPVAVAAPPEPLAATLLETMLWRREDGDAPYLWELHVQRMVQSCAALGLPAPPAAKLLAACAAAVGDAAAPQRVRLLVTAAGPRAECTAVEVGPEFPFETAGPHRRVCLDLQPGVHSGDRLLAHKTLWRSHYDQARRRVLGDGSGGIFDVVMFNERREVTETSIANIAVEEAEGGGFRTPPLSCGLLPGVMRARMLETGQLHEGVITVEELALAAAAGRRILCFNSVRGAFVVRLVGEERLGLRPVG